MRADYSEFGVKYNDMLALRNSELGTRYAQTIQNLVLIIDESWLFVIPNSEFINVVGGNLR